MTEQQTINKIEVLEQWLRDNSAEHEARPMMEADLRKAKERLAEFKK